MREVEIDKLVYELYGLTEALLLESVDMNLCKLTYLMISFQ